MTKNNKLFGKRTLAFLTALMLFATCQSGFAAASEESMLKPVQVFDIQAGKVVKTLDNDKQYQAFAGAWLKSVSGLAPQLQPEEKCGYVYRIPLAKPAVVKYQNLQLQIEDVFMFYCPDKQPVLLVFDMNRRPFLFQFKADIKPFLKKVGIPS
ncbi:hypothetical protein AB6A23_14890 [Paenibacillus tarimensis]